MRRPLTDTEFVNWVRVKIGLRPLLGGNHRESQGDRAASGYVRLEGLHRLASPSCGRCGGSGYFDGWHLDQRCGCTLQPATRHAE